MSEHTNLDEELEKHKRQTKRFRLFILVLFFILSLLIWWLLKRWPVQVREYWIGVGSLPRTSLSVADESIGKTAIKPNAVTYDKIDPNVWQTVSDSLASLMVSNPHFVANTTTNNATTTNVTNLLDGLYVRPSDEPETSDISGTFDLGLQIEPDAVELGADTTGDYIASIVAGLGIEQTGVAGEDVTTTLSVKTADGLEVNGDGLTVTLRDGSGLVVDSDGLSLLNTCGDQQLLKWNTGSNAWQCATDNTGSSPPLVFGTINTPLGTVPVADSTTDVLTLTNGDGITISGNAAADSVTFNLNLNASGGLVADSNGLSLLNTCGDGQYLAWSSGSSNWACASLPASANSFQIVAGDSGSATADSASDTVTFVGGNGLASVASNVADTMTVDIDLASGSGLAFSSGALTLQSCSDGQILKRVAGAWACASDNTATAALAAAYKQQLTGADNVAITSTLTPLLTNGSGAAQSLGITITSGNEVSFVATVQVSSSVLTGPVNYVVIRDDNHDNDCVAGGGDGTQIGGQITSFVASVAQSFSSSLAFSDTAPPAGTNYYQLCASTSIGLGSTTITNRAIKLDETSL